MADGFDQARQLFAQANTDFEAGRFAQAEQGYLASLQLLPGRASTLANLAAARLQLGQPEAALQALEQSLASRPDDAQTCMHHACTLGTLGRYAAALAAFDHLLGLTPGDALAWQHHGQTLQHLDRHDAALVSYDRALALDATLAQSWSNRGNILKDSGRGAEAAIAFRRAIAEGGDAQLNAYFLAGLTGSDAPPAPPQHYVQQLFDGYAEGFNEHLLGDLKYQGHSALLARLHIADPRRFTSALDLGCGTGLCAAPIRQVADEVDGVDLSAAMLAQARTSGLYRHLHQADLVQHLQQQLHTRQRHDLLVAADVFIYVGDLHPVLAAALPVMLPGAALCFTVELATDAVDFELRSSLRYAHSRRYVTELAAAHGLQLIDLHPLALREDQRQPIAGLCVVLRKG